MIEKHVLDNGLTVVAEEIGYAQSVLMGLWVKAGSRHETLNQAGVSHFLEHMNFKGTAKRSARELASVLECRGGQLNAYTTKEYTNFYCHVVKEDYALAMDVLSDLFLHSLYDPVEVEKEKKVVLEEINLYDDSPEDTVIDMLNEICWGDHPLARPILGYEEQVRSFTSEELKGYRSAMYTPENTVLAIVGSFDRDAILAEVHRRFDGFEGKTVAAASPPPVFRGGKNRGSKDIAQEHIAIGFPAYSVFDPRYYASVLVNEYLGGGASSRLFQKIREDLALSYSVYSFITAYEDNGMMTVYAGTSPGQGETVAEFCYEECAAIAADGVPASELAALKQQINGAMRLSVDSLGSRLNRLGRNELFFRRYIPVEEIVEGINNVGEADFAAAAGDIFRREDAAESFLGAAAR